MRFRNTKFTAVVNKPAAGWEQVGGGGPDHLNLEVHTVLNLNLGGRGRRQQAKLLKKPQMDQDGVVRQKLRSPAAAAAGSIHRRGRTD
eukprot:SAG31_NODE_488_length_14964_cov_56.443458_3_plen_88_part_00